MQDRIEKQDLPLDVTLDVTSSEEEAMNKYMFSKTVDHPDHYNNNPSGIECIDVIEHMTLNVGNAVKYLWRLGHKGDPIEQLEKAIWYLEREKKRLTTFKTKVKQVRNHYTGNME